MSDLSQFGEPSGDDFCAELPAIASLFDLYPYYFNGSRERKSRARTVLSLTHREAIAILLIFMTFPTG
ncbi:hypothetical protein [Spirulina sp. 06S082]|uniref:hypothetical protein n=1 Tax=Spirulina sp. 06S082 TaxID=3110248 RepID=UPI002B2185F9|nr:hypothetical protein [Spirulina sp. 06S082]MEA5468435.1 hypothetical protein [Spirulina sp. 06S082]